MMEEFSKVDASNFTISLDKPWTASISLPKYAWKCELHRGTFWHVEEGRQPNRFHRKMQELCFGIKWSKING